MGCGKTTHGKKLANLLNYNFIDADEEMVNQQGKSINHLFDEKGEAGFRDLETETLKKLISEQSKAVISLGGGTPCFNNNLDLLKRNGILIYIHLPPKALFNRLVNAKDERPLLKNKTNEELLIYIENLLDKREPYYKEAHIIINGINIDVANIRNQILNFKTSA